MQDKERIFEEKRLKITLNEISRQLGEKKAEKESFMANMRIAFKNMWDEVGASPNDMKDLEQLVRAKFYLDEMRNLESAYKSSMQKMLRLEKMMDSPYFARIDFIEKGESKESIYIGLTTVQDEESLEILVYDWRAPISSMFYDYDTGKAIYESPSGIIEGELTLKRQFRIRDGIIELMFDSEVKIDDEILQELLGQSKDDRMKSIVTSIQREQNLAIRDEGHKLLIVEGPAGSGKTSIALHRVAFLLYRYRNSITNENVLIFSPNEIFNDYISNVLPELGEENVRQTTFIEYAGKFLNTNMVIYDTNQQMEFILAYRHLKDYSERVAAIRYKSSVQFLLLLKEYVNKLYQDPWEFDDFIIDGTCIISKEEQRQLFQKDYAFLPLIPRLRKIKNRVLYLIKQKEYEKIKTIIEQMDRDPVWMDMSKRERKMRAVRYVLNQLRPLRQKARSIGNKSIKDYYIGLYQEAITSADFDGVNAENMARLTLYNLKKGILLFEDLAPMLYLKAKLYGIPRNDFIRHVIIDEVQDYTPIQIELIRDLFPASNFTVVGDLNQSLNPYANIGSTEILKDIFGADETAHIHLEKSYRSTLEITQFCRSILGRDMKTEYINRRGELPKVILSDEIDKCVLKLRQEIDEMTRSGYRSMAVICRTKAETEDIYNRLSKYTKCNVITTPNSSFTRGLVIIPSYLAKGLEFDAVFVLNLYYPYQGEEDRNIFYMACSRALHRLFVIAAGNLPEYINNMPKALYELGE